VTADAAMFAFDAIGTHWEIETDQPLSHKLQDSIRDLIDRFDATWSRFRADSLVTQIAAGRNGGRFELPDDAGPLLDLYDRLHELTDGALDPLVGRDLELLGYNATYSLTPASDAVREIEHQRRPPVDRPAARRHDDHHRPARPPRRRRRRQGSPRRPCRADPQRCRRPPVRRGRRRRPPPPR
jgi:FAD:protein FMN transferase